MQANFRAIVYEIQYWALYIPIYNNNVIQNQMTFFVEAKKRKMEQNVTFLIYLVWK